MKSSINIQDQFLNQVRKDRVFIVIHLLNGREMIGMVKGFDNFCIYLEGETPSLIYKHAISNISIQNE